MVYFLEYPDPDFAGSVNSINYFGCDQKEPQSRDNNPHNIGKSFLYVPTFCWLVQEVDRTLTLYGVHKTC